MKIIIEEYDHIDITLRSFKKNCSSLDYKVVESNTLDISKCNEPDVFIIRGSSIKIFTKLFEKTLAKTLPCNQGIMLSRMYPGAYFKRGYAEAYSWYNIDDYTVYDHDVGIINVEYYNNTVPEQRTIDLLPYNLNAKDDTVSVKIIEPYFMLKGNAWLTKHAGLLNFSEEMALNYDIDTAIMYPYDVLSRFTSRKKIYDPIRYKSKIIQENFGKLKKLVMQYE